MSTRICRLHGERDIRIETITTDPPKSGEVLVAMGAGGICGSDLHYYQHGGFGPIRVKEPIILGHEASGTVLETGADVHGLAVGTRVAINPSRPCADCVYCNDGLPNHCLNMRFNGSAMRFPHEQGLFRDRMVVAASQCVPVSPKTSLAEAACAEPLAVCLHAASIAGSMHGKRVVVTGAGPIGALCAAVAVQSGAQDVVVTDLQDFTLDVARQMGATRTINVLTHGADLDEYATDKGYFDIAFECSAASAAIASAIGALRPKGCLVQVGVAGDVSLPLNLIVGKEIALRGTHRFDGEFKAAAQMISENKINLRPIISASYPIDDAAEAFDAAGDRSRSVKVQITF